MLDFAQNLRTSLRIFQRSPGFSLTAIVTMALGVALTAAMFSVIYTVLLSPLPYPDSDRLTYISFGPVNDPGFRRALSGPELAELSRRSQLHAEMAAIWPSEGTLVGDRPEPVRVGVVSPNFLEVVGVLPERGRSFVSRDRDLVDTPPLIISGELWRSRFAGGDVVGREVRLGGGWGFGGGTYTIVGVMPAGFELLLPVQSGVPQRIDVWIPLIGDPAVYSANTYFLRIVGRLRRGVAQDAAAREIEQLGADIIRRGVYPPQRQFFVVPVHDELVKGARTPLTLLQAAVAMVLLIACANVATLLLIRASARRAEFGVRLALGTTLPRLATLLLAENLVLTVAGGVAGLALAYVALDALPLVAYDTLPRVRAVGISRPVLTVVSGIIALTAMAFGLLSLRDARRLDTVTLLRGSGRSIPGDSSRRWQQALVTCQLAVSVMLLVGAGLLVRTFLNVQSIDPGYRSGDIATFKVSVPLERYDLPQLPQFVRTLETRLRTMPGVESVGAINQLPLDDVTNWTGGIATREGTIGNPPMIADLRLVTPGYLDAMQATLLAGRWLEPADDDRGTMAILVDDMLARAAWPQEDPLNQEIQIQVWTPNGFQGRWGQVVGVVGHLRHHDPAERVRPEVFVPFAKAPRNQMGFVVRSQAAASTMAPAIGRALAEVDPDLAPVRLQSLDEDVARKQAPVRLGVTLAVVFALVSTVLVCVGVYGVVAYWVRQRGAEMAVRAALGADNRQLVRTVMGPTLAVVAVGLGLGVLGSIWTARWLRNVLVGVAATDALTMGTAAVLLAIVTLVAAYVPARRSTTDPAQALRSE